MKKFMVFAEAFRLGGFDYGYIGYYQFFPNGVARITYRNYHCNAETGGNRLGTPSGATYPPEMAPNGRLNGPIRLPTPIAWTPSVQPAKWALRGDVLSVTCGTILRQWQPIPGSYGPRYEQVHNWSGSFCRGFGYMTDQLGKTSAVRQGVDFYPGYVGSWYGTVNCQWSPLIAEDFDCLLFREYSPDVWGYTGFDPSDALAEYSVVLLNHDENPRWPNYHFYWSGGHDFNNDRAADDLGHTIAHWGVPDASGKIGAFVRLECSYQSYFPALCGVGWCERPGPPPSFG